MKRRFRLTGSADIKRVRRSGKSYAHPLVLLYVTAADREETHVAVSAGTSVGNAVQRNRAKRLLRAAMNGFLPDILPGSDLLLVARPALVQVDVRQAGEALANVLSRAGLLSPSHGN